METRGTTQASVAFYIEVGEASVSSTSAADVQVSLRDSNMTGACELLQHCGA